MRAKNARSQPTWLRTPPPSDIPIAEACPVATISVPPGIE